MARTRLFARLRTLASALLAERRAARPATAPRSLAETPRLSRRTLAFGGAGTLAAALAGCSDDGDAEPTEPTTPAGARVAVVGAGIAGLHCAYRLQQAGVDVTVYEASSRVGGRMFSALDEYGDGQLLELGGELIDTGHATLWALADELEIAIDDRFEENPEGFKLDVWWIGGREVPEAAIVEQFSAVAGLIADAVEAADNPDDDSAFVELDETSLAAYLEENVPSSDYPELHGVLTSAYRGEFGLELDEQSALNLVYLIDSEEPDPFRIFGDSDERYHAHEGSSAFPLALAERLGDAVELESELVELGGDAESGYVLRLRDGASGDLRSVEADHVVLALPYSVLRNVTLDVPLSELKRQIIDELGYGTNAKVMGSFSSRVWREEHAASGSVTSDLELQQVWDSSIGQSGEHGILTNFLGGRAGETVDAGDTEEYFTRVVVSELDAVFPGVADAYLAGSARLMHWPTSPYALGSYTCYRPGQWSFWGTEGEREENVHFCGEHTSADFQGWMEGGAESGAFVAAEVLDDLGLDPSPELETILELKAVVVRPARDKDGARRLGIRERHARLRAAAAEFHRARVAAGRRRLPRLRTFAAVTDALPNT